MSHQGFAFLLLVVVGCCNVRGRSFLPLEERLYSDQFGDPKEYLDDPEYEVARNVASRDPGFILEILSKMKSGMTRPMENNKRGIDFGLGRGFSGSQAAKHFLGMAAASFAGGPGKKKRTEAILYPGY